MKFYLKAFLVVGLVSGSLTHFLARQPMPWWPDTAVFGAVWGTLVTLSLFQHRRTNHMVWNALKGAFRRA